ncbi:MAG: heparan-alpha-glucosaminide N-acetyltransferase [Candidatus Diapherotrites archaeon]
MKRLWQIDFLKGIALCMMVIFHFIWDLNYFNVIQVDLYSGFFGLFQITTASLFLFLSGSSMVLSFSKYKSQFPIKWFFRTSKITIAAFFISIFTLIFFPEYFIYFGILHIIAFCSFLFAPVVNKPFFSLALASFVFFIYFFFTPYYFETNSILLLAFYAPRQTFDFFPLIPWSGIFLFGIFFCNIAVKFKLFDYSEQKNFFVTFTSFLGKNSLIIYLLHQAFLFPFVWLISNLL